MINMGSAFEVDEKGAVEMVKALKMLFDRVHGIQVLWKLKKRGVFGDESLSAVSKEFKQGRLRLETWLKADPAAIMEAGNVACMLHHGGAGSFSDALG